MCACVSYIIVYLSDDISYVQQTVPQKLRTSPEAEYVKRQVTVIAAVLSCFNDTTILLEIIGSPLLTIV